MQTATKIKLARTLYRGVSAVRSIAGRGNCARVQRDGTEWELDLSEGIDFAIYLGVFERSTRRALKEIVTPGDTVLDIGANIGAHTMALATYTGPQGRVIAFEPTEYAFNKLKTNVSLNSAIAPMITLEQIMLTERSTDAIQQSIYSSWPLRKGSDLHERHLGKRMETPNARTESLDDYIQREDLNRVDVIKMDVDGHELQVLSGARASLSRFHPTLIMEFAPYVYADEHSSFENLVQLMRELGYRYRELGSDRWISLDANALRHRIPDGMSLNVILKQV